MQTQFCLTQYPIFFDYARKERNRGREARESKEK